MKKKILLLPLFCLMTIGMYAQTTAIPDVNFEQALIDLDHDMPPIDGSVPTDSISGLTFLDVSGQNISDLTGIEDFTALEELRCDDNQLTSLDVTQNTALEFLFCNNNQLTSLDVTQNTALDQLWCFDNQLTSLDVTQNTALEGLVCGENQLTSLDVTQNTALEFLFCNDNQLTNLDVTNNTALTTLDCKSNQLTSLDVTQNTALAQLWCFDNQLTSLDVTQNTALEELRCNDNQLTSLDIRNGNNLNMTNVFLNNNPDLRCILLDEVAHADANWTKDATATFTSDDTDTDMDDICDAADDCPMLAGEIGDACDDGDANTENDTITATCTCEGTIITAIPTMGEWGLMILALLLSIIGLVIMQQRRPALT